MLEYESVPSQNAHKSIRRPRPFKYGLETESEYSMYYGITIFLDRYHGNSMVHFEVPESTM